MASASGNKGHGLRGSLRSPPWWKKQKMTIIRVGETLDDRISQLPDSLLIQILSLLPTDEAYQTSILSKRCFDRTRYLSDDDEEGTCHDYHLGFITLIQDNLQKLSCVTELTLGSWFTEVLCMSQLKGMPIPELKCKYLTLELHIEQFSLYGAAGILRASPHVETLNIDMSMPAFFRCRCNFEGRYLAEGDNIDLQSWISSFEFPNLKNVKIVNSSGVCVMNDNHFEQGFDMLFKFSEFVLKNATMLEKFVISTRIKCKRCSFNCMSLYLCEMSMKLLGCPRASTNCVFIFK